MRIPNWLFEISLTIRHTEEANMVVFFFLMHHFLNPQVMSTTRCAFYFQTCTNQSSRNTQSKTKKIIDLSSLSSFVVYCINTHLSHSRDHHLPNGTHCCEWACDKPHTQSRKRARFVSRHLLLPGGRESSMLVNRGFRGDGWILYIGHPTYIYKTSMCFSEKEQDKHINVWEHWA